MDTRLLFRSWSGGVISPELFGRLDLTKHQTGIEKALNFWVLPHGPVQNRPGTEYVLEAKDSTRRVRLVEFQYNTEQTFMLEFGHNYIRIHTNGQTLLGAAQNITGVTLANPGVVTYSGADPANGSWLYVDGIAAGPTALNGRFVKVSNVNAGANTFELTDLWDDPIDTSAMTAWSAGGTISPLVEVTTTYDEADLFELVFTQDADVLTITHPSYAPAELRRLSATSWQLANITFGSTISAPNAPTGSVGGPGGGTPVNEFYRTTAIAADTLEESSQSSASSGNSIDLTVAGNYVDVDPTPGGATVTGAIRYNVYKLRNGLYGFIGQTDGSLLRDNNITPDVSRTPPNVSVSFSGTGNYPGAVGYFEQRRAFAATDNKPQSLWLTRSGTESNVSFSIPTRDDDTIALTIKARQVHRIRHIVPLINLLLLTSGGVWRVAPQNSDILTPESAAPKLISTDGASAVSPVISGTGVIYVDDDLTALREITYKADESGSVFFEPSDHSLMTPHYFEGYTITDLTYVRKPHKMAFATRSDGRLLGLTHLPEHEVAAWHEHSTDGEFESVAGVKEGTEYPLYVVVKRTVDGRTVRYIERLHTRFFSSQADAFFVDCGATYNGSPTTTVSGLHHLEGKTVSILADGAVHPQRVVTNGRVELDYEASVVHVGLPITFDFQTLPLASEAIQAFGQGSMVNVNKVWLRLVRSSGVKAGPDFDRLREIRPRTTEPYGSPPALKNGVVELSIDADWVVEGRVCVRQTDPLPVTISSMVLEVAVGG